MQNIIKPHNCSDHFSSPTLSGFSAESCILTISLDRVVTKLFHNAMLWTTIALLMCTQSLFSASHHPQDFLKEVAGSKDEGEQIVQHFCINCHAEKPLISLGAPRIGSISDWKPRIKQSMTVLFRNTSEGLNAMPARGGCFECTDEQLILSIIAMLPEPLRKDLNQLNKTTKKAQR